MTGVVALIDQRMRGRPTGLEVPMGRHAQVYTFRDGLVVHWKLYTSQSEALEAVGQKPPKPWGLREWHRVM